MYVGPKAENVYGMLEPWLGEFNQTRSVEIISSCSQYTFIHFYWIFATIFRQRPA